MGVEFLLRSGQEALALSLLVALPVLAVAAIIGVIVAAMQAATQVQDATIAHLPRLLGVTLTLLLMGAWMGRTIATFAVQMFTHAGS